MNIVVIRRGTMKSSNPSSFFFAVFFFVLIFSLSPNQQVLAAETPCTEAGLDAAIAAGGDYVLNCISTTSFNIHGTKVITQNLTLDGAGKLTVSGKGLYGIFLVNSGVTLTLRNFTIANGNYITGGGIYNSGTLIVENTTFTNNQSPNTLYATGLGGAIYNDQGSITVTNSRFENNAAGTGGAIATRSGTVVISGSQFMGNGAASAGALYTELSTVAITSSTFSGNSASGGYGGAIYVTTSTLNILASTFANNQAANPSGGSGGGAIYTARALATINIANSTFSGNTSTYGGALSLAQYNTVNISSSTFYGNSGTSQYTAGGAIKTTSVTISVNNSLFQANTGTGGECATVGGTYSGSNNLAGSGCPGIVGVVTNLDSTLADNDGTTPTHALYGSSSAINAVTACIYHSYGTNSLFNDSDPITVDQRGVLRNEGACDIGAYEFHSGPNLTVKLAGMNIPNGGTAELGLLEPGPDFTRTLTFFNPGDQTTTLSAPSSYPAGCTLSGGFPTSLTPQTSANVTLLCQGGTPADYIGSLTFATNIPGKNPYSFTGHYLVQAPGVVGGGTPASCTDAALDLALQYGGDITFNCGSSPHTIVADESRTISSTVTLDGGDLITLSGGGRHRLFQVDSGGNLTLRHITLTAGYAGATSGNNMQGGAVWNKSGLLTLDHASFTNNYAFVGGAVYHGSIGVTNPLSITGGTFSGNDAGNGGGAVFILTASSTIPSTITGATFTDNQAVFGGALCIGGNGNFEVDITNSVINHNTAPDGGGIYQNNYRLDLRDTVVSDNTANRGGGLYSAGDGKITNISGSTFSSNISQDAGGGGGVYNAMSGGTLNILNTTFSGNQAETDQGGAIVNESGLNVGNSTFYNNHAATNGGAIASPDPTVNNISNVTFVGNSATSGGGIYITPTSTLMLQNSILMANVGGDCAGSTTFTSLNNRAGTNCKAAIAATELDASAAQHGGQTETIALHYRSTARDAAPNCLLASSGMNPLFENGTLITTDQRGLPRLRACDIGAFEYYGPVITIEPQPQIIVSGTTAAFSVSADGPGTLSYQWYQGESADTAFPLSGETNTTYTTVALTLDTPFWIRVTNEFDSADSLTAMALMNVPPQITVQPASKTIASGTRATLNVQGSGSLPLTYQWYAGDSGDTSYPIDGATGATYQTSPVFSERHYWVLVSNVEQIASQTAVITVTSADGAAPLQQYFTVPPILLTWNPISWATGYEVWVAPNAAFSQGVITSGVLSADALTYEVTVPTGGVYYWKVRARRNTGSWGDWGTADTFIVDMP